MGYFWRLQADIHFIRYRQPDASSPAIPGLSHPGELPPMLSKGKPKVTLFTGTMGPGGAEWQVCLLARELQRKGCPVRVVVMNSYGSGGHRTPWLHKNGIPCVAMHTDPPLFLLPTKPLPHQADILAMLPRRARTDCMNLCAHLALDPPDILHCFLDYSNIIGAYAGLLSGVPALRLSLRSMNPSSYLYYENWWRPSYRYLLQYPQIRLEANSHFAALDYQDWLESSPMPEVIPNAVDTAPFDFQPSDTREQIRQNLGLEVDTPLVLTVLRLEEEKCPLDMLRIFAELRKSRINARLIHVGIGYMLKEATQFARSLNLGDSVLFLGARHDIPALMAAADALLLTSRVESSPNVLLEAMAAGLPFVAPRVGGVPELASNGENGFLEAHGDIAAMAKRLGLLLENKELARSMGAKGRGNVAAMYTPERLVDNVLAAYGRQFAAL